MTNNKIIDLHSGDFNERFLDASIWQKKAIVEARQVKEIEHLDTVLANGFLETTREVPAGHWIITNPGGEEYAVSDEKFQSRYVSIGNGKFQAKGRIRAYPNPTGKNVEITAPWGEQQFGDSMCYFASAISENLEPTADRYIIGYDEFAETYEWAPALNIIVPLLDGITRP
jgi:hypothetical protein